jgi:hypothetical protein
MHGVRIPRKVVRNPVRRRAWLSELDNSVLKAQLHMLYQFRLISALSIFSKAH